MFRSGTWQSDLGNSPLPEMTKLEGCGEVVCAPLGLEEGASRCPPVGEVPGISRTLLIP